MTDAQWAVLQPLLAAHQGAKQGVAEAVAALQASNTPRTKIEAMVTLQQARLAAQGARIAVLNWVSANLGLDISPSIGGDV